MKEKLMNREYLSYSQAAALLKVSDATIKNWVKARLLVTRKKKYILRSEAQVVKRQIQSGQFGRLQQGANRSASFRKQKHYDLIAASEVQKDIFNIFKESGLTRKSFLLAVYFVQLENAGHGFFDRCQFKTRSKRIANQIKHWKVKTQSKKFSYAMTLLQTIKAEWSHDLLGFLYQSLSALSEKQSRGAFYTSERMVQELFKNLKFIPSKICDPCCGSGSFLIQAYSYLKTHKVLNPHVHLFGYDIDELSVLIARAQMTLVTEAQMDVVKQIIQIDYLKTKMLPKFDLVITNPPWGAFVNQKGLSQPLQNFRTKESFSAFLLQGLENLKRNGELIFILPFSFMNVKQHAELRRYLLQKYEWIKLKKLNHRFTGVMTNSISLHLRNRTPSSEHRLIINIESPLKMKQAAILLVPDCGLTVSQNVKALSVLQRIEKAGSLRLKNDSKWALGIVTGDNSRYIRQKPPLGGEPIMTGPALKRYKITESHAFMKCEPFRMQQMAPLALYRSPAKLVYRFICKELVFAIDREKRLTLNSVNILIPSLDGYSIESVCAILNSRLAQFYFCQKYGSLKVLKHHLENFPFVRLSPDQRLKIHTFASKLEKEFSQALYLKLEKEIQYLYKLNKTEQKTIMEFPVSSVFFPSETGLA